MPLLMCPNDNAAMQTVDRAGVQFDMCPSCRGVWLDRGELEKLMASAVADAIGPAAEPRGESRSQPYRQAPIYDGEHGERGERGEFGEGGYGRGRRRSIFDIFD